jgi:hypothetical protein
MPSVKRSVTRLESLSRPRLGLLLLTLFAAVHGLYWGMGVRFDATPIGVYFQHLDPALLRTRLLESLWYLHSQPPLFNAYLGLGLKLFPQRFALAFQVSYLLMGLALYFSLFALMRRVGISRGLALLLSTWFLASPSFILYEHWLFYTLPVALLVTLSALLLSEVVTREGRRALHAFFWTLLLLCALRSLYHLAYFLAALGALLLLKRHLWQRVALAALLPLLLLTGLYVKNLVLFGQFSTSSWLGMNLTGVTLRALSQEEVDRLVDEGKLSPVARVHRYSPFEDYPEEYLRVPPRFAGIPALANRTKANGIQNYNHYGMLTLSQAYLKDDLWIARHRPGALLIGWTNAWLSHLRASSDYVLLERNLEKIPWPLRIYDYLCYGKIPNYEAHFGRFPIYFSSFRPPRLYLFLILGLPWLWWRGLTLARKGDPRLTLTSPQRQLLYWACANILYVALVANFVEVGENHRFRFNTDPLTVMLLGLVLQAWWASRTSPTRAAVAGK